MKSKGDPTMTFWGPRPLRALPFGRLRRCLTVAGAWGAVICVGGRIDH